MNSDNLVVSGKVLPSALDVLSNKPAVISGINQRHVSSYINSTKGDASFPGGSVMKFLFPAECIDFSNHSLQFAVTINKTGGTYARLASNCSSVFSRAKLLIGSLVIFDTQKFNLLDNYNSLFKNTNWFTGLGKLFRGTGDATYRDSQTNDGQKYLLNLGCVIELLNVVLPLHRIKNALTLELTIENAKNCVETDGTDPTISISGAEFHFDTLSLDQRFENELTSMIANGGLCIPYRIYENFESSIEPSATSKSVQLPFRYQALQGVINIVRVTENIGNPAVNDQMTNYFGYANFSNSVLKINTQLMPNDKINNSLEPLELNLQLFRKKYNEDIYIANNWAKYFSITFPLLQDGEDFTYDVLQGINSTGGQFSLIHQLTYNTNTANLTLDYFGVCGACLNIFSDGTVNYVQ